MLVSGGVHLWWTKKKMWWYILLKVRVPKNATGTSLLNPPFELLQKIAAMKILNEMLLTWKFPKKSPKAGFDYAMEILSTKSSVFFIYEKFPGSRLIFKLVFFLCHFEYVKTFPIPTIHHPTFNKGRSAIEKIAGLRGRLLPSGLSPFFLPCLLRFQGAKSRSLLLFNWFLETTLQPTAWVFDGFDLWRVVFFSISVRTWWLKNPWKIAS